MTFLIRRFWRHWHRWVSACIALPLALTALTGVLLITRGLNPWLQAPAAPAAHELSVSFDQLLEAARSFPDANIKNWKDVSQIDIRPGTGLIRLRSKHNNWELQIDGSSGKVLQAAPRRVSWITALHEGSYFGDWVRYGIFLPSALGLVFLLVSGMILFSQPILSRRMRRRS